jgi:hypothetical protein
VECPSRPSRPSCSSPASSFFCPSFPYLPRPHVFDQNPHPLVVGWVEPEHPSEDALRLVKAPQAPETQSVPVQAAQKRTVVDVAPWQHALEALMPKRLPVNAVAIHGGDKDGAVSFGKASTICWAVQWAVGCSVTLKWTTRRRSCASTTRTKSTRRLALETVKKSIETRSRTWLARNVRQVWGRRGAPLREQPGDTALGHVDAELEELAMDARSAPQGVRGGHPSDEGLDLGVYARATSARARRELAPVLAEATPLSSQDGVGRPNQKGLPPPGPDPGQPDPEEAVRGTKLGPGPRSPVHGKLVAQGQVLEGELMVAAPEEGQ